MTAQRIPLLIFLLLLLVLTSQNGQTHPAHKRHGVAAKDKKHQTAHHKHRAISAHKKRVVVTAKELSVDRVIQRSEAIPKSVRDTLIYGENNRITNPDQLNKVKAKLQQTLVSGNTVVRIVHIGDSHIQAGLMTRVLRRGLQNRYGNAGRGLLFPWQVAKTNGPSDIVSLSENKWLHGRISLPGNAVECGVCGYGLQSDSRDLLLDMRLKPEKGEDNSFDIVRLFTGRTTDSLRIRYNGTEEQVICMEPKAPFEVPVVLLRMTTSSISLSRVSPDSTAFDFYGASFEKKNTPGVIYHSIGVNGADFASYNSDPLFFEQLGALMVDCYIISLGTNDAQDQKLNNEDFCIQVKNMLINLRRISPDAAFILTTPAPSYLHGKASNPKIKAVSEMLVKVSDEEKISLWDLYGIIGGEELIETLRSYGVYRPDLLHFNRAGYELQGEMLLTAFLKITL